MKKILSVVGARPQFIKAAVISRLIKERYDNCYQEYIVHTGQHYDNNMSDLFFKEMMIPEPDINLGVGSASHGKQTGKILEKIEEVVISQKPNYVLVYGDTNSTLAGALAASKLNVPVFHVEAGLRSYNRSMPEEQNRVLTDHISTLLFCPTEIAKQNLAFEGITEGVRITGDVMYDASLFYRKLAEGIDSTREEVKRFINTSNTSDLFFLLTLHRAENTDNEKRLRSIVEALNSIHMNCIFPVHPRTRKALSFFNLSFEKHIELVEPVGYLDMLKIEEKCQFIVTDSGGLQKEAYFFRKPCITLRDETEWTETVETGWNTLVGADREKIINTISNIRKPNSYPTLFGDGRAGEHILNHLKNL